MSASGGVSGGESGEGGDEGGKPPPYTVDVMGLTAEAGGYGEEYVRDLRSPAAVHLGSV